MKANAIRTYSKRQPINIVKPLGMLVNENTDKLNVRESQWNEKTLVYDTFNDTFDRIAAGVIVPSPKKQTDSDNKSKFTDDLKKRTSHEFKKPFLIKKRAETRIEVDDYNVDGCENFKFDDNIDKDKQTEGKFHGVTFRKPAIKRKIITYESSDDETIDEGIIKDNKKMKLSSHNNGSVSIKNYLLPLQSSSQYSYVTSTPTEQRFKSTANLINISPITLDKKSIMTDEEDSKLSSIENVKEHSEKESVSDILQKLTGNIDEITESTLLESETQENSSKENLKLHVQNSIAPMPYAITDKLQNEDDGQLSIILNISDESVETSKNHNNEISKSLSKSPLLFDSTDFSMHHEQTEDFLKGNPKTNEIKDDIVTETNVNNSHSFFHCSYSVHDWTKDYDSSYGYSINKSTTDCENKSDSEENKNNKETNSEIQMLKSNVAENISTEINKSYEDNQSLFDSSRTCQSDHLSSQQIVTANSFVNNQEENIDNCMPVINNIPAIDSKYENNKESSQINDSNIVSTDENKMEEEIKNNNLNFENEVISTNEEILLNKQQNSSDEKNNADYENIHKPNTNDKNEEIYKMLNGKKLCVSITRLNNQNTKTISAILSSENEKESITNDLPNVEVKEFNTNTYQTERNLTDVDRVIETQKELEIKNENNIYLKESENVEEKEVIEMNINDNFTEINKSYEENQLLLVVSNRASQIYNSNQLNKTSILLTNEKEITNDLILGSDNMLKNNLVIESEQENFNINNSILKSEINNSVENIQQIFEETNTTAKVLKILSGKQPYVHITRLNVDKNTKFIGPVLSSRIRKRKKQNEAEISEVKKSKRNKQNVENRSSSIGQLKKKETTLEDKEILSEKENYFDDKLNKEATVVLEKLNYLNAINEPTTVIGRNKSERSRTAEIVRKFNDEELDLLSSRLSDPVKVTMRRHKYCTWNKPLEAITEDQSFINIIEKEEDENEIRDSLNVIDNINCDTQANNSLPHEYSWKENVNHRKSQPIFLLPGKPWARSLSIINNFCNGQNLEDLTYGRGKNWKHNVETILNMQQEGISQNNAKNDEFKELQRISVNKNIRASQVSPTRLSRFSIRIIPSGKRSTLTNDLIEFERGSSISNNSRATRHHSRRFQRDTLIETEEDLIKSAKNIILKRCKQTDYLPFNECFPDSYINHCRKIGEGVYGEVFLYSNGSEKSVIKIIPIEGDEIVNSEPQKKFHEILSEIIISEELHKLKFGNHNNTNGFVGVNRINCVIGKYPKKLIKLWNTYDEEKNSENDCPSMFGDQQLYIILDLVHGGQDLESFVFQNASEAYAIFVQTAFSLAVAEQSLEFEHRDLHWGNILVSKTDETVATCILNDTKYFVHTKGVKVSVIDFTLSRMLYQECKIFNDLAMDPSLFEAQGEYQFDIYRKMKASVKNDWQQFKPFTNILWLDYVLDKMISLVRYKRKTTKIHKTSIQDMKNIRKEIFKYKSAFDLVNNCEIIIQTVRSSLNTA